MTEQTTDQTTATEAATVIHGEYRYTVAPAHPHPLRLANIETFRLAADLHRLLLRNMSWDTESEQLDHNAAAALAKLDSVQVYTLTVTEISSGDIIRIDTKTFDPADVDHATIRDICGVVRVAQEALKELEGDVQTAHARFHEKVFAPVEGETGLGSIMRRSALEEMRRDLSERGYAFVSDDPLEGEHNAGPVVIRIEN